MDKEHNYIPFLTGILPNVNRGVINLISYMLNGKDKQIAELGKQIAELEKVNYETKIKIDG